MKKILAVMFLLVSAFSFSKEFFEKKNFTTNVSETVSANRSSKTKGYVMNYNNGTLRLTITSPNINKGEVYTFSGSKKTIYYPKLKQTVTQNILEDEANILSVFRKLSSLTSKKTQTKNGDMFTFSNSVLTSIKSRGYTVNFSGYKKSGEYNYPTQITVKDGNSQVTYRLSNFK